MSKHEKKTALIIGEKSSGQRSRLLRYVKDRSGGKYIAEARTFDDVLDGNLPEPQDGVLCHLFWPNNFVKKHKKEWREADGIYGGPIMGNAVNSYFDNVGKVLEGRYGAGLELVNSIESIKINRDKAAMKKCLKEYGVSTPREVETRDLGDLKSVISEKSLFVKVRFGGVGRGMTRLSKDSWMTNFGWASGKIVSPFYDKGWQFKDITGEDNFLKELLIHDVVIEEEVRFPLIEGKKFDMRIYLVYGKPVMYFARTNLPEKVVTNWGRGGKVDYSVLEKIPSSSLFDAKDLASTSYDALGKPNFFGVDVIFSEEWEPFIIDSQTDVGLPKRSVFDLLGYLAEKVAERCEA